jgi:hypothetical protein
MRTVKVCRRSARIGRRTPAPPLRQSKRPFGRVYLQTFTRFYPKIPPNPLPTAEDLLGVNAQTFHPHEETSMSISSVNSGLSIPLSALSAILSSGQTNGTSSLGQTPSSTSSDAPPPGRGLIAAVFDALASIGATSTTSGTSASADSSSTSGTTSTASSNAASSADVAAAFQNFLQSLLAALQAQSSDGSGGGPGNALATDVQSLIASLTNATSNSSTSSDTTSTSTSTTSTTDSALQASFDTLVGDLGGTGSTASLTSFLQSFAANLPSSSLGHWVNAQA